MAMPHCEIIIIEMSKCQQVIQTLAPQMVIDPQAWSPAIVSSSVSKHDNDFASAAAPNTPITHAAI
jgi:hypothetical protein